MRRVGHARRDAVPRVRVATAAPDVIHDERQAAGMTCVVDNGGQLVGIVTDGDLRRHMSRTPNLIEPAPGTS